VSGPLAATIRTEWDKVRGLRRPSIFRSKVAGVSVIKWTAGLKKRGLAFATPNKKSDDGTTCKSDTPRVASGLVSGAASKAVVPLV
jgi:hypothetical protein